MKRFLSVIDRVNDHSGKIFSFMVLAAAIVVVTEVTLRYAFNNPTIYGLELTLILCSIAYMLAGAYALRSRSHVRVDILYLRWTPRVRAIIDLVTAPVFFLGIGLLMWVSAEWTINDMIAGTGTSTIWNPLIWPIRLFLPLGTFLMLLQGLANCIRDFGVAREKERPRIKGLDESLNEGVGE